MIALFVALGIAVLTLLALLLWFVPHLLQQQALRTANEAAQLREMLLDMLNEQEAVTMRQAQLGTSIAYLQDQLEQMVATSKQSEERQAHAAAIFDPATLRQIEERVSSLQAQIQTWHDGRSVAAKARAEQDNEAWAYLLSLLATIQDRIGTLSQERAGAVVGVHAGILLEELEQEMQHLHTIANDIATLQWRLRRSLSERESNISALRGRTSNSLN